MFWAYWTHFLESKVSRGSLASHVQLVLVETGPLLVFCGPVADADPSRHPRGHFLWLDSRGHCGDTQVCFCVQLTEAITAEALDPSHPPLPSHNPSFSPSPLFTFPYLLSIKSSLHFLSPPPPPQFYLSSHPLLYHFILSFLLFFIFTSLFPFPPHPYPPVHLLSYHLLPTSPPPPFTPPPSPYLFPLFPIFSSPLPPLQLNVLVILNCSHSSPLLLLPPSPPLRHTLHITCFSFEKQGFASFSSFILLKQKQRTWRPDFILLGQILSFLLCSKMKNLFYFCFKWFDGGWTGLIWVEGTADP